MTNAWNFARTAILFIFLLLLGYLSLPGAAVATEGGQSVYVPRAYGNFGMGALPGPGFHFASAEVPPQSLYGGPFLERSTLTGNWGGWRDSLAAQGIVLNLSLTQFYQGLAAGTGDHAFDYGGKADLFLTLDGGKLGLWNGFGIVVHGEYNYGRTPAFAGGTILPNNTALTFPCQNESCVVLTSVYFTQRLGTNVGLSVGKINMIDAYANSHQFSGGRGIEKFQNMAFAAPVSGIVPPYIFGAIVSVSTAPANFTFMVYDPKSAVGRAGLEDLFAEGVSFSASVQFSSNWWGLPGKHWLTAAVSSEQGIDLANVPDLSLPPGSAGVLSQKHGRYYVSYAFEQTIWQGSTDPAKTWGAFGQVAFSDGNPNPVAWSVLGGVGGTSPIPGRERDTFGAGVFYIGFSNLLKRDLSPLVTLGDEYGCEVFYNVAVTPWFRMTADAQGIMPGLRDFGTAIILGLRAQIIF